MQPGFPLIDTITADPIESRELADQLECRGISMLDATIIGTSKRCVKKDIFSMRNSPRSFDSKRKFL